LGEILRDGSDPDKNHNRAVLGLPLNVEGGPKVTFFVSYGHLSADQLARHLRARVFYDQVLASVVRLLSRGEALSLPLSQFAARALAGEPPPKGRKELPWELILVIGSTVQEILDLTPNIYRNETTSPGSCACDAVAEAATSLGYPMTYHQVAKRYRQHVAMQHPKFNP
jgi:hypothetical protein